MAMTVDDMGMTTSGTPKPTRPEDVEHGSERDVLRALMRLPSPWVAMHSLPWLV